MTYKREVEALVRKCQRILGLQDWRVKVSMDHRLQPPPGAMASCRHHPEKREAVITVRSADEIASDGSFLEALVIHELLHLRFVYMDIPGTDRHPAHTLLLEQCIEATTRALCEVGNIPFGKVTFL